MVKSTKPATKEIVIDNEHFVPTEPSEPILPLTELEKKLGKSENEKWTACQVAFDKETGEKVLIIKGMRKAEKDRSKRMVKKGGEFDPENIVSGTRRRKNINYKENTERKESRRKSLSKNTLEHRSKAVEKASKKKKAPSKKRKQQEEEEDKENIENQEVAEEEEEIIQAPKRTRKNRKSISKVKEEVKEEEPQWTLPLSPLVCQLIQKLGGVLPTENKARSYKEKRIAEPVNYWCGVKWPEKTAYAVDTKLTDGETIGIITHQLFELDNIDGIKWLNDNPSAIMLADGEGLLACLPEEVDCPDFNVYLILEATEGAEECVYKLKLSEYLAALSVDPRGPEEP